MTKNAAYYRDHLIEMANGTNSPIHSEWTEGFLTGLTPTAITESEHDELWEWMLGTDKDHDNG